MTIESKQYAEFESFKKITKPEELTLIREQISNPKVLTGFERLNLFYSEYGLDFDKSEFEQIINDCQLKLDASK